MCFLVNSGLHRWNKYCPVGQKGHMHQRAVIRRIALCICCVARCLGQHAAVRRLHQPRGERALSFKCLILSSWQEFTDQIDDTLPFVPVFSDRRNPALIAAMPN